MISHKTKSSSTQHCSCELHVQTGPTWLQWLIVLPRVAGSETTASSLASLINNLLRHPDIYAKLKQEIRTAFNSEDEIKLEVVQNLSYLSACIEENLRVFPPAPIGFLREIPTGGDMIDGYFIPEGVCLSIFGSTAPS